MLAFGPAEDVIGQAVPDGLVDQLLMKVTLIVLTALTVLVRLGEGCWRAGRSPGVALPPFAVKPVLPYHA